MSEYIQPGNYPTLSVQHLEILPNLSAKLQYFEVPTVAPAMSYEEKTTLLDVILKCFLHEETNIETGFKITYLLDDQDASAIRATNLVFNLYGQICIAC